MPLEDLPEISAKDFGKRIARAFMEVKSSNVFYFLQIAYKEEGGDELEWDDVEELLNKVIAEE